MINSDEHDAEHGVRSVREQPMATERRGSGAMSHGRHRHPGKPLEEKRGDVKRAGAEARTSEHDRAYCGT